MQRTSIQQTFSLEGNGCEVRVGVLEGGAACALMIRSGDRAVTVALEGADALRLGTALIDAHGQVFTPVSAV